MRRAFFAAVLFREPGFSSKNLATRQKMNGFPPGRVSARSEARFSLMNSSCVGVYGVRKYCKSKVKATIDRIGKVLGIDGSGESHRLAATTKAIIEEKGVNVTALEV